MGSATKLTGGHTVYLPGVSYLLDKIDIEMDDEIVIKVEHEFLDFLKSLTDIMKLMHLLKTKHLRCTQPIPAPVIREIMSLDSSGPRYKTWDRMCSGNIPGISPSADNIFRSGHVTSPLGAPRQKPVYRKDIQKRRPGLENELIEITGKKTKPLWHVVALEPRDQDLGTMDNGKGRPNTVEDFSLAGLLNKRNRPVNRSRSEQLLVNIKALVGSTVKASTETFEAQMDMMLAKDAGFASVKLHKEFLDTQKPHWYKDLIMDCRKVGILYSLEMIEAFEALGRYYETTSTSINFAKAKMAYLVMSLPVWDVCQASVQRAIDFFISTVLEIPSDTSILADWLRMRKLPYLVHEPLTAEMLYMGDNSGYQAPAKSVPQTPQPEEEPPSHQSEANKTPE